MKAEEEKGEWAFRRALREEITNNEVDQYVKPCQRGVSQGLHKFLLGVVALWDVLVEWSIPLQHSKRIRKAKTLHKSIQ